MNDDFPIGPRGFRLIPADGEPRLLLDTLVALNANAGGGAANLWISPRETYFDVDDGDQLIATLEAQWSSGGAPKWFFQRTQSDGTDDEVFEDMDPAGETITTGRFTKSLTFGRLPTTVGDKPPQRLLRGRAVNGDAVNPAFFRMRVWGAVQRFGRTRTGERTRW